MDPIAPAVPLSGGYVLNETFSDDFAGTELDSAKWHPFYPDWEGRKAGRFVPENVSVKDGALHLTAQLREPVPPAFRAAGYQPLTTALVRSRTRILYGFFQMEFKAMPACLSSAFFLNDSLDADKKYKPGSFSDEIDIFEIFGKSTRGAEDIYFNTCHRIGTPYKEGIIFSGITSFGSCKGRPEEKQPFHFREGFHTASFLWEKDRLRWYLDGRLTFDHPNDYYHHPMYMNIDSEPFPDWCGAPDPADLPAVYTVRYVRVWQNAQNSSAQEVL